MLPFAIGVCKAVGGRILTEAFGTVALVAMMPLITVQIMGVRYVLSRRTQAQTYPTPEAYMERFADTDIIELWEVE